MQIFGTPIVELLRTIAGTLLWMEDTVETLGKRTLGVLIFVYGAYFDVNIFFLYHLSVKSEKK